MKNILCFGDSNTWGYEPVLQDRLGRDARWPGVLRLALGDGYNVIEEGLGGRTTVWDDPIEGYKNGHTYLIPCLESHRPLDLVIIMLGTNDLKKRFSLSAFDIAEGAKVLVKAVQSSGAGYNGLSPQTLLIAPPPTVALTDYAEMFEGASEKSLKFAFHYQRVANETGCAFLNAGDVISSSPVDGIHFAATEHQKLGQALALKTQAVLSQA